MVAAFAFENPSLINNSIVAAFDINSLSIDQSIGNCLSALLDDSAECGPGDTHATPGYFVRHSEQVGESNGSTLVNGETHLFQLHHGNTPGFKIADCRIKGDPPVLLRPYHVIKLLYENILKKNKIKRFPHCCQVDSNLTSPLSPPPIGAICNRLNISVLSNFVMKADNFLSKFRIIRCPAVL